ncbi:uncharacterized protein involved in exopolysaccharide biosynthesis [Rhodoblastus acidophilus]|uniref:Wzz/FepE/Etk N-terminal domain-containing protein n=1 Tax=Rhodoblastus acidophilus TaxID=1074 RepID=UPI002224380C|nr:Wzz/FepE/Etk N-terminal domain-containing protein [Rhodoblastus acidophilus]MCW2316617.1 uncharacterized protein involved in exopolysaccharide biosynthesis [Rhodoblastus acidophilus]
MRIEPLPAPINRALAPQSPTPEGPPGDPAVSFGAFAAMLRRRNRTVLGTLAATLAVAALYAAATGPIYVGEAQILVDPHAQKSADDDSAPGFALQDANSVIDSQLRLIKSESVLRRAAVAENLAADPEYGQAPLSLLARLFDEGAEAEPPEARAIRRLSETVKAKRSDRSFVIEIKLYSIDRAKAARLANAVADAYLEDQSAARGEAAQRIAASMSSRLATLRDEVRRAELAVDHYKFQHNTNVIAGAPVPLATSQAIDALRELERNLDASRAVYQSFLLRTRQIAEQGNLERRFARIISHAAPATAPTRPALTLLALSALGGLGLGVAVALAREKFDTTIHSHRDLLHRTDLPVLGCIPFFSLSRRRREALFLRLRDTLKFDQAGRRIHILLLASIDPARDAAATATHLARSAIREGERALLVDTRGADELDEAVAADCAAALVEAQKTLDDILRIAIGRASSCDPYDPPVLTIDSPAAAPAISGLFERALAEGFDLIVVDCCADAPNRLLRSLAHAADGVALVARSGQARIEDLEETLDRLAGSERRIQGVIVDSSG